MAKSREIRKTHYVSLHAIVWTIGNRFFKCLNGPLIDAFAAYFGSRGHSRVCFRRYAQHQIARIRLLWRPVQFAYDGCRKFGTQSQSR